MQPERSTSQWPQQLSPLRDQEPEQPLRKSWRFHRVFTPQVFAFTDAIHLSASLIPPLPHTSIILWNPGSSPVASLSLCGCASARYQTKSQLWYPPLFVGSGLAPSAVYLYPIRWTTNPQTPLSCPHLWRDSVAKGVHVNRASAHAYGPRLRLCHWPGPLGSRAASLSSCVPTSPCPDFHHWLTLPSAQGETL